MAGGKAYSGLGGRTHAEIDSDIESNADRVENTHCVKKYLLSQDGEDIEDTKELQTLCNLGMRYVTRFVENVNQSTSRCVPDEKTFTIIRVYLDEVAELAGLLSERGLELNIDALISQEEEDVPLVFDFALAADLYSRKRDRHELMPLREMFQQHYQQLRNKTVGYDLVVPDVRVVSQFDESVIEICDKNLDRARIREAMRLLREYLSSLP